MACAQKPLFTQRQALQLALGQPPGEDQQFSGPGSLEQQPQYHLEPC